MRRIALIALILVTLITIAIPSKTRAQSGPVDVTPAPYCDNPGYDAGCFSVAPEFPAIGETITASAAHFTEDNNWNFHVRFSPCAALKITGLGAWTSPGGSFHAHVKICDQDGNPTGGFVEFDPVTDTSLNNNYIYEFGMNSTVSFSATFQVVGVEGVTPSPPAASKYQPCPTQNDKGILPGTWTYTPPVAPDPSGIGLVLNGGAIQKNFSLSRFHEYDITIAYKLSTAGPPEPFIFSFGKNFNIQLITSDTDTEDTVHLPAASYEPSVSTAGADLYAAAIGAISPPSTPHLVITYFCLLDATAGAVKGDGTGGAPTGNAAAVCKDCVYEATGDLIADVLGVLKWIWCGLSQLWDCTIKSLFYGIWKFVGVIITALAFLRQWAGLIFTNGATWLGAVLPILWNFIRGLAGNVITTVFNALAGVFNALGITGIINAILAFLENIPGAISQFMSFIPGVVSLVSTIWNFITYWVTTVWNLVSGILGAIPVVFASVIAGFNQSAASIPVYAPTCNSSSTLFFGPCLGMYIIDNTVFDGPMYYVFPLVLGFVALNVIMWSIEKFKEALSGD